MSLRTAPMVSVTLPSQKDGTSSHILCATPAGASAAGARQRECAAPAQSASARARASSGAISVLAHRQLAPWPDTLAGKCRGSALSTKQLTFYEISCIISTGACAQPQNAARLIRVVKEPRLLVQPEESAVAVVSGHEAFRQIAPPFQHEAVLNEVCVRTFPLQTGWNSKCSSKLHV